MKTQDFFIVLAQFPGSAEIVPHLVLSQFRANKIAEKLRTEEGAKVRIHRITVKGLNIEESLAVPRSRING